MQSKQHNTCHKYEVAHVGELMLHPRVLEGPPAKLVRLQVDHATSGHCGRGGLLQVSRLKDQVHLVGHLDDFSRHQTELQISEAGICST